MRKGDERAANEDDDVQVVDDRARRIADSPIVQPAAVLASAVRPEDFDHAGIVVRDFDTAMRELSESLGAQWGPVREANAIVLLEDGPRRIRTRFAFTTGFPQYELVTAVDGTHLEVTGDGLVHHLSYYTDDVRAASERLSDLGYPRALAAGAANEEEAARSSLVMHRSPYGPYIELIGYRSTERYAAVVPSQ
jgi:hypothetical protein